MTEQEEIVIIISQRDIRIPLKCPVCNTWTKNPIKTIKTECLKCKKDFEKSPTDDQINQAECLRDAAWLMIRTFMIQETIPIQFTDNHKETAQLLVEIFSKSFGIEIVNRSMKNIFNEKFNKNIVVNRWVLGKPEWMSYNLEK